MLNRLRQRIKTQLSRRQLRQNSHLRSEPSIVLDNQLLSGKNVLITGAGRNIGRSIALEMAQQGANIFFTELDTGRRDQLSNTLKKYPIRSLGFICDSANPQKINQLCNTLSAKQIKIDILVNNAGIQIEKSAIKQLAFTDWQQTFDTNVLGPLHLTQRIALDMIENAIAGSIIFITSIHQWENVGWPSYSASKAALGMAIKELAVELSRHNIRVNGIAPGWVAENTQGNPLPAQYALLRNTSINPKYIGRAAIYLAADYFSYFTTGSILKIDAGMSLCNFHVIHSQRKQ